MCIAVFYHFLFLTFKGNSSGRNSSRWSVDKHNISWCEFGFSENLNIVLSRLNMLGFFFLPLSILADFQPTSPESRYILLNVLGCGNKCSVA